MARGHAGDQRRARVAAVVLAIVASVVGAAAVRPAAAAPNPLAATVHGSSLPARSQSAAGAPGSSFHRMLPLRVLDSRTPIGNWNGPLAAGADRTLALTYPANATIPETAKAVVLNVTATDATAGSFLSVFPDGAAVPATSTLNFARGQTVANLATVAIGAGGRIRFANAIGSVSLVADIAGWYDDGVNVTGDRFTAMTPSRMFDSRTGAGGWNGPLPAGMASARSVLVGGAGVVPADATAVAMNVTVTEGTANSFLRIWPTGSAVVPDTSSVNFAAGQTTANLVVVGTGNYGFVSFFNAAGQVDVVVDVVGYFATGAGGSLFHPIGPDRILDDRTATGLAGPWHGGQTRSWTVAGTSDVPASATALVANTTVTNGSAGTFLTVFPAGSSLPVASMINAPPGATLANLTITGVGAGGQLSIFNAAGSIDVIADAVGYFAPS